MEFGLLGPLEVQADGGPVRLRAGRQRALLTLLVLHGNRVVARERLIDELWGNEPPATANKVLQVYVSQLRNLLPRGTLLTRRPGYMLEVDPEAIDLRRFERLVDEARGAGPAAAAGLLREALGLWRGPALADVGDAPFVRVEAGRLEELRLAALEERIDADLALGRHSDLAGELDGLVAAHPHRERLRGQLMLALYRSGRQVDALAAFRDARVALGELGLEPGPALRELERQVLAQDPALELRRGGLLPDGPAIPGPLVPEPAFPFVGRERELELLGSLLDQARSGEGGLVLLAGEAGAGKTRLVRELAREAAAGGVLVCYGASDAAVRTPYEPVREWLEFLLRACEPGALRECLEGDGELLARLVPGLGRLTRPAAPAVEPEPDRHALQAAAAGFVGRISRHVPLLLVADDVHWADAETLRLLRRLARDAPAERVLVVVAFRDRGEQDSGLSDTLAELWRLDGVTRLALGNLGAADVSAFVRRSADADATDELVSAIGELTEGTPLLVCELWRELRESGAVEVSKGAARLARPVAELRGPERVRGLVQQRVSRLDPQTTALLELAAAAGPRFELRMLAEAAALDRDAFVAAVEKAVGSGLVEELPEPAPTCRFAHELVRRAVYDGIGGPRRAELHLRVGEALERVHTADLAPVVPELAHHFALAVPLAGAERAVGYLLRAGEAAIAAGAFEEGAARLAAALELGIADPRERARVQVELAYILRELGRYAESDASIAAGLDAATGAEERGIVARALVERIAIRVPDPRFDLREAQAALETAVATLGELGDRRGRAVAGRQLGIVLARQGRIADACEVLERALEDADASGDRAPRRQVAGTLGWSLVLGPAPVGDAIRRCEELRESSRPDAVLEAALTRFLALLAAMAGRPEEAREHLRRSGRVLDELDQMTLWSHRRAVSETKELLGDRAGAEKELLSQWVKFRDLPDRAVDERAMNSSYRLAVLYCDEGRWDEAAERLAYGREVPLTDSTGTAILRLVGEARLAAHRGLEEAPAVARRALELVQRTDNPNLNARAWLALAEVQRATGAEAEADAATAEAIRLYERKGNVAAAARLRAAR